MAPKGRAALQAWLAAWALLFAAGAWAGPSVREQEIAQCRAVASPIVLVYDHAGAPPWFTEAQVRTTVEKAAAAWSACGIAGRVLGATAQGVPAGAVRVEWSEPGSRSNFGLANLTAKTLSLGPGAFAMLHQRNPRYDAGLALQMVVSHEMGHFYGLMAHSRRCVDVTSYYHDGKGSKCYLRDARELKTVVEYRASLPTACDIQRCRAANGMAP